jgi:hypothetical protein
MRFAAEGTMRERKGLSAPVPEARGAAEAAPAPRRSAIEAAAPEHAQGRLGLDVAGSWRPLTGTRMVVGRADGGVGADVEIADASLSRRHAEFIATTEGWQLRDLGSMNGTRIGEVVLQAGEARAVQEGDVLRLGSLQARVERR